MILKVFKEKSNIRHLNKILSSRDVNVTNSKIKGLGVIMHINEIDDFELFRKLAENLNIQPFNFKIIAYSSESKEKPNSWDICFNEKDFGWKGTIHNVELQSFLETDFDVLISYYEEDILELKLITAKSKAQFKIGIFQPDSRLNDLIIQTKLNDFRNLADSKKKVEISTIPYIQMFDQKFGFLKNLSILDLLFMEGPNSINFLEK